MLVTRVRYARTVVSMILACALILTPAAHPRAFSTDLPNDWAREDVLKALEYGLIPYGMYHSFTSFISRSDFCKIVMALYTKITGEPERQYLRSAFRDTDDISIKNAYELGIVRGVGDGRFAPDNAVTRQEIAVMLYNAINAINAATGRDILNSPTVGLPFNDGELTAYWAVEAIKSLRSNDIMIGDDKNCFNPLNNTTKEMAFILVNRTYLIYSGLDAKKAFPPAYTGEISMRLKNVFTGADGYHIMGDVLERYPDISLDTLNRYLGGEMFIGDYGEAYLIDMRDSLGESVAAGYTGGQYYPVYVLVGDAPQYVKLYIVHDGYNYNLYVDSGRRYPYLHRIYSDVLLPASEDAAILPGELYETSYFTGDGAPRVRLPATLSALYRESPELIDSRLWHVRLTVGTVIQMTAGRAWQFG